MDNNYLLRDRTVFLAGPLSSTTQSIMAGLCELGADVALVDAGAKNAEHYCANLCDQREAKPKHGRAAAFEADLSKATGIKDALGKVAQTFGGIDVYIDAQVYNKPSPIESDVAACVTASLTSTLLVTEQMVPYLKGRKKGRIVYLLNDSCLHASANDLWLSGARSALIAFAANLGQAVQESNITVNCCSLGMSEEYLLAHYPKASIKEALEFHRQKNPGVRLTEPEKITSSMVYLVSQLGAAVNGQFLKLS